MWDSPPQWEVQLSVNDVPDLWCSSSAEGSVWLHLHIGASVLMMCCDDSVTDRRFFKGAWGPLCSYLQNLFAPLPEGFLSRFLFHVSCYCPSDFTASCHKQLITTAQELPFASIPGWNGWVWVKALKTDWAHPHTHTHSPSGDVQQTPWGSLHTRRQYSGSPPFQGEYGHELSCVSE